MRVMSGLPPCPYASVKNILRGDFYIPNPVIPTSRGAFTMTKFIISRMVFFLFLHSI